MPLYIAQSGDLEGCHACLTDRLTTLKDRATQLLIKYKSGALVTQFASDPFSKLAFAKAISRWREIFVTEKFPQTCKVLIAQILE